MKENIYELMKKTIAERESIVLEATKETIKTKADENITKFVKVFPNMEDKDVKAITEVLLEGLTDAVATPEVIEEFSEEVTSEVEKAIDTFATEAKVDAIPEELKVFVKEDGAVDTEKMEQVNTAIAEAEKKAEYAAFLETDFIKGIKDADVTVEKFDEIKGTISSEMFEKIMKNEVKENALLAGAFVKVAEPVKAEEVKKSAFESVVSNLDEEKQTEVNEALEEAVKEVVDSKLALAKENNLSEDQIKQFLGGKTVEEFTNATRETLADDFAAVSK